MLDGASAASLRSQAADMSYALVAAAQTATASRLIDITATSGVPRPVRAVADTAGWHV